jgi:hypothetical protein
LGTIPTGEICKVSIGKVFNGPTTERFLNGFKLHYAGPRFHRESSNLVSASQHKDELKAKVQKEIDLGRIVGPFKTLPIDTLQISPVGIVPKSDGKSWRMHPNSDPNSLSLIFSQPVSAKKWKID